MPKKKKDQSKTNEKFICELEELHREVTELKKEKIINKETEEALQENEQKYRSLAETSQKLIWKCDKNGCLIDIKASNLISFKMFGDKK